MHIEFPHGLPGFEHERSFSLSAPQGLEPLICLQSVQSPSLRLWTAAVDAIDPNYSLELTPEDLGFLGLDTSTEPRVQCDVQCLAVLCATENRPLTANLLAPIVINPHNGRAVQAVRCDQRYSHQHPITAPVNAEAAC